MTARDASPAAELERLLGTRPPDAVLAAGDETVAALAAALRDAKRRQAEELLVARDATLRVVPWPLRGIVKRTLGV